MIQKVTKPRGRPRSFDELEALEKATQVFWSKGYDGVTIDDLVGRVPFDVEKRFGGLSIGKLA